MLAYEFRVATASGIYFSSWLAFGKSTTPNSWSFSCKLEHPARGDPLTMANWGNSMWRKWGSLWGPWHPSRAGGQLCAAAICWTSLGKKLLYFLLIIYQSKQTAEPLYIPVESHLYSCTLQLGIGVQINRFSQPQQSHDKCTETDTASIGRFGNSNYLRKQETGYTELGREVAPPPKNNRLLLSSL